MAESIDTTQNEPQGPDFDEGVPSGGHALEVAARAGFGPLSPLAGEVWHGQSVPCVSCGQLAHRDDPACEHCGQDLSEEMIQKMRQHAGPWFVHEYVRPFPGVSLERVIRQIRRGLITETSIVRGPSNDYQWRFAVETPGLCRYFGKCWCCHGEVSLSDAYCPHCLHYLSFEKPRPSLHVPGGAAQRVGDAAPPSRPSPQMPDSRQPAIGNPVAIDNRQVDMANAQAGARPCAAAAFSMNQPAMRSAESTDLARLSVAVRQARAVHMDSEGEAPLRVAGVNVAWIAALMIVATVVALLLISRARSQRPAALPTPSLPTMQPASSPSPQSSSGSAAAVQPATPSGPISPAAPDPLPATASPSSTSNPQGAPTAPPRATPP